MELQILHAIQGIHQEWLTEILRFFTTIGESGLVWIAIAIVLRSEERRVGKECRL